MIASLEGTGFKYNEIFDLNSPQNRDNCFAAYWLLRQELLTHNIELNTSDLTFGKDLAFELHMNVQKQITNIRSYVLLLETPQICPDNQRQDLLANYQRIFTWNDDLVDGTRYIKLNYPNKIIIHTTYGWQGRDKLCCMIAGNKAVTQASPLELYSERVKTIRWFEKNAPQDFDLLGIGWNLPAVRQGLLGKVLHRLQKYLWAKKNRIFFPSYRGKVASKLDTLHRYRFSICYENVRDVSGYITEKIFDSFFAGCIPVYWGASNVSNYIPENCFIDRRKFPNHQALYSFMQSMTEENYVAYQQRIADFLESDVAKLFNSQTFANTIVNTIVGDMNIAP